MPIPIILSFSWTEASQFTLEVRTLGGSHLTSSLLTKLWPYLSDFWAKRNFSKLYLAYWMSFEGDLKQFLKNKSFLLNQILFVMVAANAISNCSRLLLILSQRWLKSHNWQAHLWVMLPLLSAHTSLKALQFQSMWITNSSSRKHTKHRPSPIIFLLKILPLVGIDLVLTLHRKFLTFPSTNNFHSLPSLITIILIGRLPIESKFRMQSSGIGLLYREATTILSTTPLLLKGMLRI